MNNDKTQSEKQNVEAKAEWHSYSATTGSIRNLPPFQFRYGNYGADIPTNIYVGMDANFVRWLENQKILGYSRNPEFKPLKNYVAVLFDIDGGEYWSHVPDRVFNEFNKESER